LPCGEQVDADELHGLVSFKLTA